MTLDRHESVERKAYDAQVAHDNNDVRGCFARALHGGKPRAHKTILKKNGEKTHNEDQRKVARMNTARFWDLSPEAIEVSIARCRRHKATGRDLLSNEVMQAGGWVSWAIKTAETERCPKEFQGG